MTERRHTAPLPRLHCRSQADRMGRLIHQHDGQQDGDVAGREVTSQKEHSKGSKVVSPRGDRVNAGGERPAEEHLGTPNRAIVRVVLHVAP